MGYLISPSQLLRPIRGILSLGLGSRERMEEVRDMLNP